MSSVPSIEIDEKVRCSVENLSRCQSLQFALNAANATLCQESLNAEAKVVSPLTMDNIQFEEHYNISAPASSLSLQRPSLP